MRSTLGANERHHFLVIRSVSGARLRAETNRPKPTPLPYPFGWSSRAARLGHDMWKDEFIALIDSRTLAISGRYPRGWGCPQLPTFPGIFSADSVCRHDVAYPCPRDSRPVLYSQPVGRSSRNSLVFCNVTPSAVSCAGPD